MVPPVGTCTMGPTTHAIEPLVCDEVAKEGEFAARTLYLVWEIRTLRHRPDHVKRQTRRLPQHIHERLPSRKVLDVCNRDIHHRFTEAPVRIGSGAVDLGGREREIVLLPVSADEEFELISRQVLERRNQQPVGQGIDLSVKDHDRSPGLTDVGVVKVVHELEHRLHDIGLGVLDLHFAFGAFLLKGSVTGRR